MAELVIDLPQGAFEAALIDLFGEDPLPEDGVLQTSAVTRRSGESELRVLHIDAETPASRWDSLMLYGARAWSDVIVSSGSIWRQEPGLDYGAPVGHEAEWWEYRQKRGRQAPPEIVVLTTGRSFPLAHRALQGEQRVTLFGPPGLKALVADAAVPAVERASADAVGLLDWYLRTRGADRRVLIELGPSAAASLHRGRHIERMLLSVWPGSSGNASSPVWPSDSGSTYRQIHEAVRNDERSGRWMHRLLERVER